MKTADSDELNIGIKSKMLRKMRLERALEKAYTWQTQYIGKS